MATSDACEWIHSRTRSSSSEVLSQLSSSRLPINAGAQVTGVVAASTLTTRWKRRQASPDLVDTPG
jgi:hypothetical protein